jgi:hypothetical protein
MPNISVADIETVAKKIKFSKSDSKKENTYFSKGNIFFFFLSSKTKLTQRESIIKNEIMPMLMKFNPEYTKPISGSTAGGVTFNSSPIKIIAKIGIAPGQASANKGNQFESSLLEDFNLYKKDDMRFKYASFMKQFIEKELKGKAIKEAIQTGGENVPRPLMTAGSELYVSVRSQPKTYKIGSGLADIKLTDESNKIFNLSLKYGSTVSFFNSGVGKIFTNADFTNRKFASPMALPLLDLFGIDPDRFINIFLNYNPAIEAKKAAKQIETPKVNILKISEFMKTVIGTDYHLIHLAQNQRDIHYLNMTPETLNKAATITSGVHVEYPLNGSAKRIDIKFESSIFEFKVNIRNKQGGISPSHIMCDYKFKH